MKPRKPLKRSSKPLKRSPLKRGLGRRGKVKAKAMKALHEEFPRRQCQWKFIGLIGNWTCLEEGCDFHHKQLRSQGGQDVPENLVALCRQHHSEAHADFSKLERIRQSGANLLNGEVIK